MHHGQRECGVRTGANTDPLVALLGGSSADRVDRDNRRAVLSRLSNKRPQVRVGGQRVRSPEEHQVTLRNRLAVRSGVGPDRHLHAHASSSRTDRAIELRRAQQVKEATVHRVALDETHGAGIGVRKNGLRPIGRSRNGSQPFGDGLESLVPSRGFELPTPFFTDSSERREQTVTMIRAFQIPIHLRAEKSLGERMIRIALNSSCPSALHRNQGGARIWAVMWAGAAHHLRAVVDDLRLSGDRHGALGS